MRPSLQDVSINRLRGGNEKLIYGGGGDLYSACNAGRKVEVPQESRASSNQTEENTLLLWGNVSRTPVSHFGRYEHQQPELSGGLVWALSAGVISSLASIIYARGWESLS